MQAINNEAIVALIEQAANDVFSTMLGLPIAAQASQEETGDPSPVDGVVALVGIAGTWTGSGRIYCSPEFARRIAGGLLGTQYAKVDDEVLDAVAEVANMIIGNVKTGLEARLGQLGLSIPTVIFGRRYQARSAKAHNWIVIPFVSGSDIMEIRFCLVPTSTAVRTQVHHHEPALA